MRIERAQKEISTIDSPDEHNKVLLELGLLDDLEDWRLYQEQERIFNRNIDALESDEYFRLIGK
jgi:hypothetical protein